MAKKSEKRKKTAQFNVRMPPAIHAKFMAALDAIGLQRAGGGRVTRTDVIEYWATWWIRLSAEDQREWVRTYREAFRAYLADLEGTDTPPAEDRDRPDRAVAGPVVTMEYRPPSDDRAVDEEHQGPQRKPRPRRPTRK